MKRWTSIWIGSIAGIVLAAWLLSQNPRPAFCVLLQAPLTWLFSYIDSLHVYPHESLASLIIVIPVWFVYWTGFGALVGFLLQLFFSWFRKPKRHDDGPIK
jgi:hypothetical protein